MRRTVAEIQKCKPGLCLPDKAEDTLMVFKVVDQLQDLLLDLEKVGLLVCQLINVRDSKLHISLYLCRKSLPCSSSSLKLQFKAKCQLKSKDPFLQRER